MFSWELLDFLLDFSSFDIVRTVRRTFSPFLLSGASMLASYALNRPFYTILPAPGSAWNIFIISFLQVSGTTNSRWSLPVFSHIHLRYRMSSLTMSLFHWDQYDLWSGSKWDTRFQLGRSVDALFQPMAVDILVSRYCSRIISSVLFASSHCLMSVFDCVWLLVLTRQYDWIGTGSRNWLFTRDNSGGPELTCVLAVAD